MSLSPKETIMMSPIISKSHDILLNRYYTMYVHMCVCVCVQICVCVCAYVCVCVYEY